jgi:hypothetical protein
LSSCSTEVSLLGYLRERFPAKLFLPLTLFLATPSGYGVDAMAFAKTFFLIYALVFQFRLWDDLNDREADRLRFPERTLPRALSLAPFWLLWLAASLVALLLLIGRFHPQIIYLVALVVFDAWYRWARRLCPPILRYHVLLLKYPFFVYLGAELASPFSRSHPAAAMALVYLTFVLYEPLHDARLRGVPGIQAVVSAELILWALVAASYSALAPSGRVPALLLVALSLVAAGLAVFCFHRFRRKADCAPLGRAVVVVSFLSLLSVHGLL